MKGLLRFEMGRRWRAPGTWMFLALTLAFSGIACLLKNVRGGISDFETMFTWGIYALILGSPLLAWGSSSTDRKNDAWKMLASRGVSPFRLALVRIAAAWSVCIVSAAAMLTAPGVLCLLFDSLYFPSALCAAAAYLSLALLTSALCVWLDACAQRPWQAALTGAIVLGCVFLLSLASAFALSGRGGAVGVILILVLIASSLPVLLCSSSRGGMILGGGTAAILLIALLTGGHQAVSQLLSHLALFDHTDIFMLGILDLSVFAGFAAGGLLFALLTALALSAVRGKKSRRHRRVLRAVALAAAVCVGVMALLPLMPDTLQRMDATRLQLAKPAPAAREVLSASDAPVHAYFLATEEDVWIEALLARYAALDDRFTYSFVDLTLDPDFGSSYYGARGENNCMVLTSGDRYAVIPQVYLYTYSYAYDAASESYYPTDLVFDAQSRILTAVQFLSQETLPTVGVLTGHYESQIGEYARDAAYSNGYFLRELDLSREVPGEDLHAILIQNPMTDITEAERDMLIEYLQKGGGLMLSTNCEYTDTPNLFAVMDYCGIAPCGILVMEGAAGNYMDYGYYPAPVAQEHDVTAYVAGNRIMVPTAHGLALSPNFRSGMSRTPLLSTTDYSYAKNSTEMTTLDFEEGDIPGPITLAMASTDTVMRSVWVSGDHLSDSSVVTSGTANLYFWLGQLHWTTGIAGETAYVEAAAPSLTTTRLLYTHSQTLMVAAASLLLAAICLMTAVIRSSRRISASRGA